MNKQTSYPEIRILFTLMMVLCSISGFSQKRTCGAEAYMIEKMADPEFAREFQKNQFRFKEELSKIAANKNVAQRRSPIVIPIAVHFPEGSESDRACLEALAQNQIDILNADYSGTNSDIANWSSASTFYPGVSTGATNISFCLASKNHPANTDAQLVEGSPAITIGYNFGNGADKDAKWAGYMNFVVKSLDRETLGYSPIGGNIAAGHAVVISLTAFGIGVGCSEYKPKSPYNLGRTLTHELGHFYNLPHLFSGSCTTDDGIADTPNDSSDGNYGCQSPGSINRCGNNILTMNYMDYADDACMYMFTSGQATVVDAYILAIQSQFKSNVVTCTFPPDFFVNTANPSQTVCPVSGALDFNFSFTTQYGFNENTMFSASGQPAGSTVSFNPPSLNSNGNFTMTINNLGGVALGDYTIEVKGTSPSITNSQNVALLIRNTPCASVANTEFNTSTTGVIFNTISNLNSGKLSGYSDYTSITTDVNKATNYDLTVKVNTDGDFITSTRVWIDWNQNCSFNDSGEEYILGTAENVSNQNTSDSPYTITVPANAVTGTTIMRISTKYLNAPSSCENGADGEVEDYTINVLPTFGEESVLDNFTIFPNPNKGRFTVTFNTSLKEEVIISVFDIRGRIIYDNTFESSSAFNQRVELKSIQSGMYLVKISNGALQATKTIIIQ